MADSNLQVTLTGDAAALVAALQAAQDKIEKLGNKGKETTDQLGNAFDGLSMGSLAKMALGFGTLAGAAEKAMGLIVEGIKDVINIIPQSIEKTGLLVDQYKQLHQTAGMSIQDFNRWTAVMELSGAKVEDLNDIVSGMEKGIKKHSDSLVANGVFVDDNAIKHASLGGYIDAVVKKMEEYDNTLDANTAATSKDQLLMDAFGKSGMAFAATLVEINERKKEGMALGEEDGILTKKAIADQRELTKVKGELEHQDKLRASLISEYTDQFEIQSVRYQAYLKKQQNETILLDNMVKDGLITLKQSIQETQELDGTWSKQTVNDYEAMKIAAKEYFAEQEKFEKLPDGSAAIANFQKHGNTDVKGKPYDHKAGEKEASAKKEAQEATNRLKEEEKNLTRDILKLQEATTIDQKKARDIAEENNRFDEEQKKLKEDLAKGGNKSEYKKATEANEKEHQDKLLEIDRTAGKDRQKLLEEVTTELTATEKNGLEKRLAEITDKYAKIREKIKDGSLTIMTDDQLIYKEGIEKGQAYADETKRQVEEQKKALEELKKSLAEEANINGGAMSRSDVGQSLDRFASKGSSQASAVKEYKLEMHWDETASQGALRGFKDFVGNMKPLGTQLHDMFLSIADGFSNSLGKAFTDILTKGKHFGQAMKEVWKSLTSSIVSSLAQMIAKKISALAVDEMISLWSKTDSAKTVQEQEMMAMAAMYKAAVKQEAAKKGLAADATETASTTANDATQTSSGLMAMASKVYAFFASMGPYGILAATLTVAGVVEAVKAMGKVTAHATGGLIDSPTMSLMGERGPEIVAPKDDFMAVTKALVSSGASMYGSIVKSQARVNGYAGGSNYRPSSGSSGGNQPLHVHLEGAVIAGESVESARIIGNMIQKNLNSYNRRNG